MTSNWEPPYTFEEKLKYALIPPRLYIKQLAARALKKGEPELHLLPFLAAANKMAVDVGANKGIYTYFLAKQATRVEAFEPNPKIFRVLARALPSNAVAHPVALSNSAGTARLMVPQRKIGYSNQGASLSETKILGANKDAPYGVVEVEARTIDSYNYQNLGFIKIDVEGFERPVLDGAAETIEREHPVMLIEIEESHTGEPIEEQLSHVESLGYDGFFLDAGRLTSLKMFDPERNHRSPPSRPEYAFNFIFLPHGKG